MAAHARRWVGGLACLATVAIGSCGDGNRPASSSGGSTPVPTATNVVPVVVDGGPIATTPNVNTLFTTVTVCVPGSTTQCQTIDHIEVDTGSFGFRVLASVLTLPLKGTLATDGGALVECTQFADGYSWGPVASADLQIGGETAGGVPIQIIGASNYPTVPTACAGTGTAQDTVAAFGANGILGIGVFTQDCGTYCVGNLNNPYYYSCPSSSACAPVGAPVSDQVVNPVSLFVTDNNGTIIDLPAIADAGAATVTGSLIFGIDTQTNNASGTQTVLPLNNVGEFMTVFNGQTFAISFLDTGTNGIFFVDPNLTPCQNFKGFYCPTATQTFSATLTGQNGVSTTASFTVGDAETLANANPSFTAFPTFAGTYTGQFANSTFDWGLPFYFGRRVATAIEGQTTKAGTGPYVAF